MVLPDAAGLCDARELSGRVSETKLQGIVAELRQRTPQLAIVETIREECEFSAKSGSVLFRKE